MSAAADLERRFLAGLDDAQSAYEQIVATEAWTELGHDSFAAWWETAVRPTMRALSMRPTREIAAAVVERVRAEDAELPPAQRRTQRELAELAGVHPDTVSGRKRQDPDKAEPPLRPDLEPPTDPLPPEIAEKVRDRIEQRNGHRMSAEFAAALDRLVPDTDPWSGWRASYIRDIAAGHRVIAGRTIAEIVERSDSALIDELLRFADEVATHATAIRAALKAERRENVVPLRSVR